LGIGDWGLGNPQSPIPNPHIILIYKQLNKLKLFKNYEKTNKYYII